MSPNYNFRSTLFVVRLQLVAIVNLYLFGAVTWARTVLVVGAKYSTIFPIWSLRNCKLPQRIHAFVILSNYSGGMTVWGFFLLRSNLAGNQFGGNLPYSISTMTNLKYLWVSFRPGVDFTLEYVSSGSAKWIFFLAFAETSTITNYKETSPMYFPAFIVWQMCKYFVGIVRWVLICVVMFLIFRVFWLSLFHI